MDMDMEAWMDVCLCMSACVFVCVCVSQIVGEWAYIVRRWDGMMNLMVGIVEYSAFCDSLSVAWILLVVLLLYIYICEKMVFAVGTEMMLEE
jgi:hypothetical protein